MIEKIKSKYRESKYSIEHIKENPVDSLIQLMPVGMCLFTFISFVLGLLAFPFSGKLDGQLTGSFSNDMFTLGTVGMINHSFFRSIVNVFLIVDVVVIALKYYKGTNSKMKIVFVIDTVILLALFFFYLLTEFISKHGGPVFLVTFIYNLFYSINNFDVKVLGTMIVTAVIFAVIVYKSNYQCIMKDTIKAFLISYIILPIILLILENLVALVKFALFIVIFGGILIIMGWMFVGAGASAVSGGTSSDNTTKKNTTNKKENKVENRKKEENVSTISYVNEMGGWYLYRKVIDDKSYIIRESSYHIMKVCLLEDYLNGKYHIYHEETGKEVKPNEIPWKD